MAAFEDGTTIVYDDAMVMDFPILLSLVLTHIVLLLFSVIDCFLLTLCIFLWIFERKSEQIRRSSDFISLENSISDLKKTFKIQECNDHEESFNDYSYQGFFCFDKKALISSVNYYSGKSHGDDEQQTSGHKKNNNNYQKASNNAHYNINICGFRNSPLVFSNGGTGGSGGDEDKNNYRKEQPSDAPDEKVYHVEEEKENDSDNPHCLSNGCSGGNNDKDNRKDKPSTTEEKEPKKSYDYLEDQSSEMSLGSESNCHPCGLTPVDEEMEGLWKISTNFEPECQKLRNQAIMVESDETSDVTMPSVGSSDASSSSSSQFPDHIYSLGEQFEFRKILGKGAFGTCKLFLNCETDTLVAVKEIPRERFDMNELKIMQKVCNSPYIISFYKAIEIQDNILLLMAFAQGGTLKSFMRSVYQSTCGGQGLDLSVKLNFFHGIMDGVKHLHSKQIVHADLKSENILMVNNGSGAYRPVLCDFGLSIDFSLPESHNGNIIGRGTVQYRSPELCYSQGINTYASDIWSCGCILKEIDTGDPPWADCAAFGEHALVYKIGSAREPPIPRDGTQVLMPLYDATLRIAANKRLTAKQLIDNVLSRFLEGDRLYTYYSIGF